MYKYAACKPSEEGAPLMLVNQKDSDRIFRDINIEVNGFYTMNHLAYWSLRLGGTRLRGMDIEKETQR